MGKGAIISKKGTHPLDRRIGLHIRSRPARIGQESGMPRRVARAHVPTGKK